MQEFDYLEHLKVALGITHDVRDKRLTALIESVKAELINMGIELGKPDSNMLVVDIAVKRYYGDPLTRDVIFRIKNLIVKYSYGK